MSDQGPQNHQPSDPPEPPRGWGDRDADRQAPRQTPRQAQSPFSDPYNSPSPVRNDPPSGRGSNSAKWLWFVGGFLFGLIGVVVVLLANIRKDPADRNDALRYAAWGLLAGVIVEIVLMSLFGFDPRSMVGFSNDSFAPSSGSVF